MIETRKAASFFPTPSSVAQSTMNMNGMKKPRKVRMFPTQINMKLRSLKRETSIISARTSRADLGRQLQHLLKNLKKIGGDFVVTTSLLDRISSVFKKMSLEGLALSAKCGIPYMV